MKIEFYRTILCPRCLIVSHQLKKLQSRMPNLTIEIIEIVTNPDRAREAGIRTIPALKVEDEILTGLFITPAKIKSFLSRHMKQL